jgi:hypothetical protein
MKGLRFDPKSAKRIGLARDTLIGMSDKQLASVTSERLQQSFGLTPDEAGDMLRAFCRS